VLGAALLFAPGPYGVIPIIGLVAGVIVMLCQSAFYVPFPDFLFRRRTGSDAAEAARVGIPSTTIIAMPTGIVRADLVYHTPRDTVEHIEAAAIEACMRIALRYLSRLDAGETALAAGGASRPEAS
jgi:hypothetical protein